METRTLREQLRSFAKKSLVAPAGLFLIAAPAIGVSCFLTLAARLGVSGFILGVLTYVEYAILLIDSFLLIVFLLINAWHFLKEMFE